MIGLCAGHVNKVGILLFRFDPIPGSSGHNVGIHINRVNRVADGHLCVRTENFLNIRGITLCPVGDKDFIIGDIAASGAVILLGNRIPKKFIPQIRRIAVEGFCVRHIVYRTMKRGDNRRRKRLCHIADSQPDNASVRMSLRVGGDLFGNRRKKIISL